MGALVKPFFKVSSHSLWSNITNYSFSCCWYLSCSWHLWNSLQELSPPQEVGHSGPTLLQMHPGTLKTFLGRRNWLALLSQFCLTSSYSQGWHSDTVWSSFHLVPCVFIPWHSGITRRRAESVHMNWGTVIPCLHCWSQARVPPLTMLQQ